MNMFNDVGYIYAFSNDSMPGILKIGTTEKTPNIRLGEANEPDINNMYDIWRPPLPYKLEIAKKVVNMSQKEATLYTLLSRYTERINPKREFFRISTEEIKTFFDLIDGETWQDNTDTKSEDVDTNVYNDMKSEDNDNASIADTLSENGKRANYSRDATKCFTDGQLIRHTINPNKTWVGVYNLFDNTITHDNKIYKGRSPLNQFVKAHYDLEKKDIRRSANAWVECECEKDGKWISTFKL